MKRKLLLMLIACILLTGCESITMEKISKKIEKCENYEANVTLSITGKLNKENVDYKREKFITIDNINSSAKVKAIVNQNEYESREVYYIKSLKNEVTTYKKNDEFYQYKTESKDQNSIYYITAFINENMTYQKLDSSNGITHFVMTLNKDRVKEFLNSYYDVEVLKNSDYYIKGNAKIHLYVNNKTKSLKSISVDFSEILRFKNSDFDLETFSLDICYDNFNKADVVEIPKEYKENSLKEELIDSYNDAVKYVEEVNKLKLNKKVTTYNKNTINYDGIKPDSVSLTVVKGIVISGSISINGYDFKVESGKIAKPNNEISKDVKE